jgi:hypothetical protein
MLRKGISMAGGGVWPGFQVVAGFDTGITIKDCADNMGE